MTTISDADRAEAQAMYEVYHAHDALAAVLPDLLAEAWNEGYAQAVADHLLMYDNSDDTPNPYRPETITRDATDAPVTPAAPDATNPPPDPSAAACPCLQAWGKRIK